MKVHDLKCWPREFRHVQDGRKTFEVRKNDRDFREGDLVILREYVPEHMIGERIDGSEYGFKYDQAGDTGRSPLGPFRIGYVTECKAIPDGWVGFELIKLVEEVL
jgi:hypothetical protein